MPRPDILSRRGVLIGGALGLLGVPTRSFAQPDMQRLAPPTIAEGDVVWVYHQTCNSMGYEPSEVGGRLIWFMGMRRGQLVHHYCSTSLQSSAPTPHVLLESRSRWLARRR